MCSNLVALTYVSITIKGLAYKIIVPHPLLKHFITLKIVFIAIAKQYNI